jgi:hypothetical protein
MSPETYGAIYATVLGAAAIGALEIGRRLGVRGLTQDGEGATKGLGAIENTVLGLLGLILAFTFSGALNRFDARRQFVVNEVNSIRTAWLRIDLLPPEVQPPMRDLFRQYLDSRIDTFHRWEEIVAMKSVLPVTTRLQREIWSMAVASSQKNPGPGITNLLLPAINEMIDITTTRTEATRLHPPLVIYAMLGILAIACALFAGYEMAARRKRHTLHSVAFAFVLAVTVYLIIDLEYPRMGLIQMSDSDEALATLRKTMN